MSMVEQAPSVGAYSAEQIREKHLSELRSQLDSAREAWAAVSVKRQNRAFNRKIDNYNEVRDAYNLSVIEYGREMLAEDLFTADDADRRSMAVAYVIEQQNELRARIDETTEGKRSRKIGKALDKWFSSGSRMQKIAKVAAVGAVASVTGGLVGAGIAATAAVRFTRGYVASEVSKLGHTDMEATDLLGEDGEAGEWTFDELVARAQERSSKQFNTDAKDQNEQHRRAVKRGLGVMATGMVLGGAIGYVVQGIGLPSASANDTYQNPGIVSTHGNPGIYESMHANPGLVSEEVHVNPGIYEPEASTVAHTNPGVFASEQNIHKNPGIYNGDGEHANPGVDSDAHEHRNPGIFEGASADTTDNPADHGNPGIVTETEHKNPGIFQPEVPTTNQTGSFTVEYGHGYTHELIEAAAANGVDMTVEQSLAAHEVIVDSVGADYIDLVDHDGADTYSMGASAYDTGISASGEAVWSPEALSMVNDAIDDGEINQSYDGVDAEMTSPESDQPQPSPADSTADADQTREERIVERADLRGLEEAAQDNADWAELNGDIEQMEDFLRAGDLEAVNGSADFQDTLSYIARDARTIEYPGSNIRIMAWDKGLDKWVINPVPENSYIPDSVIDLVREYQQSLFRLAA